MSSDRIPGVSSGGGVFYVENLGCAKNQVDAEVIIASLKASGWTYAPDNPDSADLIIVNTCGFIRSAQQEALDALMGAKREYPHKRVIAAGCLAQRWAKELSDLLPELDGVFGNRSPRRIAEITEAVMAGKKPVFTPEGENQGADRRDFFGFKRSVFLKIADGCDHRCRYCAIPLIKGPLVSRPEADILAETDALLAQGVYEINLVAQDLSAYGSDRGERGGEGLIRLLRGILDTKRVRDDFRIRLLYLHPDEFPLGLLDLMASDPRLLPYLDIPFQHASAPVLRAMGRSGNTDSYLRLIDTIRGKLPDAAIRSTFLVGHPGEGRREFAELLRFQERAELEWVGVFAWSREEGTPSAEDRGVFFSRFGELIGRRRKEEIEARQTPLTEMRLERMIGREIDVLVEEPVDGEELAIGRGPMHAPEVDGSIVLSLEDSREGDVVRSRITGRSGFDLRGEPVAQTGKTATGSRAAGKADSGSPAVDAPLPNDPAAGGAL